MIIANEVLDEARRNKKSCIIFKLDYEEMYGSISWEFLDYMLARLGSCVKWRSWFHGCLAFSFISVLINNSPSGEFVMQRGIRQGDPLALFLFTITGEGL